MSAITKVDLDALARKKRVRSLHKWFAVLQRSASKPALLQSDNSPKYSQTRI